MFWAQGHEAAVAHSGPEALRLTAEFRPTLIMLDIGLPGMIGCMVAERLRSALGRVGSREPTSRSAAWDSGAWICHNGSARMDDGSGRQP
ncbi:Transcriptional regulatory protein AfsQ1 [Pirellulimonas nuda]|uniref:Transcriptional regulatory protein AfsQ1 n=1 Tax=Pirellulimonas nuda TaxID=2528009 RepID=A0A518DDW9_9BACT|nr:response regulator [Pirellulimonas nuda]QDU89667.1 Transcriptional regulatory protein AfsQ1 [Pirellulimonas nuda]